MNIHDIKNIFQNYLELENRTYIFNDILKLPSYRMIWNVPFIIQLLNKVLPKYSSSKTCISWTDLISNAWYFNIESSYGKTTSLQFRWQK